jgi:hypothetical protein
MFRRKLKKCTHVYIMLTFTCADFDIKTTMCDVHINVKIQNYISNSTKPIIILSFKHFVIFL